MDLSILSPVSIASVSVKKEKNGMEVDGEETSFVSPGETVTTDQQFMRGHGTYAEDDNVVVSSVAGTVERVNKLLTVKAIKSRYNSEIGDIVVGRITEVKKEKRIFIHYIYTYTYKKKNNLFILG